MEKRREMKASARKTSSVPRPNRWAGPLIIVLAALVAVGPLMFSGPSCSSDFAFHYISWVDAQHSMSMGVLYPHWANSPNFGAGEPKFVFYPPLTWMAGAVLGTLLPWTSVPIALFVLLLSATGLANRALARMSLSEGPATLAGCASIFLGYTLFSIYRRNDFGELAGEFWIPLLLLFALRLRNPEGPFWERVLDGSATPLALVVAGMWLSNGPVGLMASYLLVAVTLASAFITGSPAPVVRAAVSTLAGMGLAAIYLIPAICERNWASIQNAANSGKYLIENNWLFAIDADPQIASDYPLVHYVSWVGLAMLIIAFGGGAIVWMRGVMRGERRWWLPIALIPPAILILLFPFSHPVWNALPGLRLLQFPWRWLVVLEAPMAICFASAVWSKRRNPRNVVVAACAAGFVGIGLAAPQFWFEECGSLITSLQESVRTGIGVVGKPEYTPPGTRRPLADFQLDAQGNLLRDSHGDPIVQIIPSACLLKDVTGDSTPAQSEAAPGWDGDPAGCDSTGWQEAGYLPERKWFTGVAAHAGYAILRLRFYPAWAVMVNGRPVTAMADQERALIAVPVPKGNVQVSVEWTTTNDVLAGRLVSGAALILVAGLFFMERKLQVRGGSPTPGKSLSAALRV